MGRWSTFGLNLFSQLQRATDHHVDYMLDGVCLYDAELKGIVVMATSIKPWQRIQRDKR